MIGEIGYYVMLLCNWSSFYELGVIIFVKLENWVFVERFKIIRKRKSCVWDWSFVDFLVF